MTLLNRCFGNVWWMFTLQVFFFSSNIQTQSKQPRLLMETWALAGCLFFFSVNKKNFILDEKSKTNTQILVSKSKTGELIF